MADNDGMIDVEMAASAHDQRTVRETVLETIEAPRLTGVPTRDFVAFRAKRLVYERKLAEKAREHNMQMRPASYRSSVDPAVLTIMVRAQWVQSATNEAVTDDEIRACISRKSELDEIEYDLPILERQLVRVKPNLKIPRLADRMWDLFMQYEKLLIANGYTKFVQINPIIAIRHVISRIDHANLKSRANINLRQRKRLYEASYSLFCRHLAKEARTLERGENAGPSRKGPIGGTSSSGIVGGTRNEKRGRKRRRDEGGDGNPAPKTKRKLPPCLIPRCKRDHYLKDCDLATREEKKALLEKYRREKRAAEGIAAQIEALEEEIEGESEGSSSYKDDEDEGSRSEEASDVARVEDDGGTTHSSLFRASFIDDAVTTDVLTDQGSPSSFLPADILSAIQSEGSVTIKELESPRKFNTVKSSKAGFSCRRMVCLTVALDIGMHAPLVLRIVSWLVPDCAISTPIIGRDVLDQIGLNNKALLLEVFERYDGQVDCDQTVHESEGTLAALFQTSEDARIYFKHNSDELDLVDDDEEMYGIDFGETDTVELRKELDKRVLEAAESGLSQDGVSNLRKMLSEFEGVFKLRLGAGEPADVEPMKIRLRDAARPLIEIGFVEDRPLASWQAAPLVVLKPGTRNHFRLTIDLKPINASTIKESWPLPNLESEMQDFSGDQCFASVDFLAAYWQLALDEESIDKAGIVTNSRVVASRRVLQGLANSAIHFQRSVEPLFAEIKDKVKAYIDDFNIHCSTEQELLETLEKFFMICRQRRLYISAVETKFYLRSIKWCGRVIDGTGFRLDPHNISALRDVERPQTADELCQYVHCCRWMPAGIPRFAEISKPLVLLLEKAHNITGNRKKRPLNKIHLSTLSWGAEHDTAFHLLQDSVKDSVKLAFPKKDWSTHVFTDASETFWAGVVTQTPPGEKDKAIQDRCHEPLAFLGAEFKKSQLQLTMYEKEAFAIYSTFKRLDYLLYANEISVHTDHRNLIFVFNPRTVEPMLGRHIVSKVQRWALFLSRFDLKMEHIPGDENVMADILTRWMKGYRKPLNQATCAITMESAEGVMPSSAEVGLPDTVEIKISQERNKQEVESMKLDVDENGLVRIKDKCWIPQEDTELQLKIFVGARCGIAGHRGIDATKEMILEEYWWQSVTADVDRLTSGCLHCLVSRSGKLVQRPLAHALHGSKPNEVVHMDYLYMGSGQEDRKYLLIIKDDLSGYVWLFPSSDATAQTAADSIMSWIAAFGTFDWLISDQGPHFKNRLLAELANETRTNHHFTTAYSPWSNGTVERVCREVLRACRALCSEWKLGSGDWPSIVECIQSILNQSPLPRLGKSTGSTVSRTPLEVFTGLRPKRSLMRALPFSRFPQVENQDDLKVKTVIIIDQLQEALEGLHRDVDERVTATRKKQVEAHNRKTGVMAFGGEVGEFVLVRCVRTRRHKIDFIWRGPRRIVEVVNPQVYIVEQLITGQREKVLKRPRQ